MDEQEAQGKIAAFKAILNGSNADESSMQRYIEGHPYLLTGISAHISFNLVVSQFQLGNVFRADFAWINQRSFGPKLHLLEIESPKLQMFNKNGDFSQGYNHAVQQLRDWHHWTTKNSSYLEDVLAPLGVSRDLRIECQLIAGRTSDLESEKTKRRYGSFQDELQSWMCARTWDGFLGRINLPKVRRSDAHPIKCVTYRDQAYFEKQVKLAN